MIDLMSETVRTLADLSELVPSRGGKTANPATLHRWATRGIAAPDGSRIVLEAFFVGGRRYSSEEALERFIEAVTAAKEGQPIPEFESKPSKACLAAEAELIRMGL